MLANATDIFFIKEGREKQRVLEITQNYVY